MASRGASLVWSVALAAPLISGTAKAEGEQWTPVPGVKSFDTYISPADPIVIDNRTYRQVWVKEFHEGRIRSLALWFMTCQGEVAIRMSENYDNPRNSFDVLSDPVELRKIEAGSIAEAVQRAACGGRDQPP